MKKKEKSLPQKSTPAAMRGRRTVCSDRTSRVVQISATVLKKKKIHTHTHKVRVSESSPFFFNLDPVRRNMFFGGEGHVFRISVVSFFQVDVKPTTRTRTREKVLRKGPRRMMRKRSVPYKKYEIYMCKCLQGSPSTRKAFGRGVTDAR